MSALAQPALIETWYQQHHSWLGRWLQRKTGCHALAADLMQDTFVRLLRRSPQPHPEPRALLCHIARGLLIDHWRRADLEAELQQALASLPEVQHPAPEQQLLWLELLLALDHCLLALPLRARQAFILHRVDGLPCAEVARQLGVSLSTVEKDLARAMLQCLPLLEGA